MNKSTITFNSVSKLFDDRLVLDNINLNLESGKIIGITGTNGSGKSTLVRLMSGVYKPDTGTVLFNEHPVFDNPLSKNQIVLISDKPYYPLNSSIHTMKKRYSSMYDMFDEKLFMKLADYFELSEDMKVSKLSKGKKRLLSIILAFSCGTSFMLLDETFDGIDPINKSKFKHLLFDRVTTKGLGCILTSHSLFELSEMCDEIILIDKGKLVVHKDITDLRSTFCKVMIAFDTKIDSTIYKDFGLDVISLTTNGRLSNIIFKNSPEECRKKLTTLSPLILETAQLSLDEIFILLSNDKSFAALSEILTGKENTIYA